MTSSSNAPDAQKHYRLIETFGRIVGYCAMLVGSIAILLLVMNLMAAATLWALSLRQESNGDPRARMPVYDNVSEDRKFHLIKTTMHFEPYFHWRREPFASQYINVDVSGMRKTVKSPAPGAVRVFVFGGSTVWGTGVADAYTVPSLLQRRLGPRYDVYNYGESAFVSVQELNLLLRELAFGNVPDAVIFYDGDNDIYAGTYSPAVPRDPQNERDRQQSFAPLLRVFNDSSLNLLRRELTLNYNYYRSGGQNTRWDNSVAPRVVENVKKSLDAYEQFVFQARAIARAYGFKVYFFWQPNLLSGTRISQPHENEIIQKERPLLRAAMHRAHEDAKARMTQHEDENLFFLGNVLDQENEPLYIDAFHLASRGNDLIADEIFQRLRGRM